MNRRNRPMTKREAEEFRNDAERQYHENRRKAEAEGKVAPISSAAASECCNAGVFWSQQAVVCKDCGKVQE